MQLYQCPICRGAAYEQEVLTSRTASSYEDDKMQTMAICEKCGHQEEL